ncbi:MAG: hypothetical protein FJX77_00400, partial [Armatimonadetes bacterium]|nr:hypothetical protein [Armatimonadota bacterium]
MHTRSRLPGGLIVVSTLIAGVSAIPQTGATSAAGPHALPKSAVVALPTGEGAPLQSYLPAAGRLYGIGLSSGRTLQTQRVTVCGSPLTANRLALALAELLHVAPDGAAVWALDAGNTKWRLEESQRRRRLRELLVGEDDRRFLEYMESRRIWLRDQAEAELKSVEGDHPRIRLLQSISHAGIPLHLSQEEWASVMRG